MLNKLREIMEDFGDNPVAVACQVSVYITQKFFEANKSGLGNVSVEALKNV